MNKSKHTILTSILVTLAMIISTIMPTFALTFGDVNNNSDVDVMDATAVQRHIAQLDLLKDDALNSADVDNDKEVTVMDATMIQRYVAQIIDKFPAEDTPVIPEDEIRKIDPVINIHFSNNKNWTSVYAYVYNYETQKTLTAWPGTLLSSPVVNDYGESVYSMQVDTSKYDRVIFNNGSKQQTTDTPVTVANSGYFAMSKDNSSAKHIVGVYPYGQNNGGDIEQVNLEYSKGYNKRITIWTPEGYDPTDTSKKYSVLYMTDGQNIFGNDENCSQYEWEVDETVHSYMVNGGDGIIVVGIDNANSKRDSELTPDIGDVVPSYNSGGFKNGTGEAYADFVVEKVIPYVEANYNTNSIRGIAGSSSGGIESFYIGMEHMDKFNYIGAISPAFLLYSEKTWSNYLDKFDFSDSTKLPRIYFFNGNSPADPLEQELYPNAVAMQGWLEKKGYDSSLMKTVVDNDAKHNEVFWAVYFPEALAFGLGY